MQKGYGDRDRGWQVTVLPCGGFSQHLSLPSPRERGCCTKGCDLVEMGSAQHGCLKHPGSAGPFPSPLPEMSPAVHPPARGKAEWKRAINDPQLPRFPRETWHGTGYPASVGAGRSQWHRALCCLRRRHCLSLLCHGACIEGRAEHSRRAVPSSTLSPALGNSLCRAVIFLSPPSLAGSSPWYALTPPACPVPALDCVPVRNQLLEGLLALQDDGKLLLGEREARVSGGGLRMGKGGWDSKVETGGWPGLPR